MSTRLLTPLPVSPSHPEDILPNLELAIAGRETYLPVPAEDIHRAELLRTSQRAGEPISEDIALVVATSGSTGTPKGAMLTPRNLVSSADATHKALGGEGQWLLALPPHHIAGIQVLVRSVVAGYEPLCLDVSHGFSIGAFAAAAHELADDGGYTYTSLVPLQLLKAMDELRGIEALRRFHAILVGGAPLADTTRRQCRELGIHVVCTYGSSETAGGCVYNGLPIPGARIHVTGERIHLGGPMIAQGYRNSSDDEAFAYPMWFSTQDTGQMVDGRLQVTGRIDTVIDSGGLKLHPVVVESAMLGISGVKAACVVGVPHPRLGQAVVAVYVGPASPGQVIAGLSELPRWQLPKELKRLDALPLTGPGKVDRRAGQRLF